MEEVESNRTRRLPPGRRGIPADLVARNQRERLIAAIAEACAEHGYASSSVTDIVKRANVSTVTFYSLFTSKEDCMLAAQQQLLERLLEEVDRACAAEREPRSKLAAAIHTVLSLFASDPPTARLLTVEILALGPAGVERHDAAIEAFAARLRASRDPRADPPLPHAEWSLVAAMSMLIGKCVMAGDAGLLLQLEDEFVAMATAV